MRSRVHKRRPATPEQGWTAGGHERGLGWPGKVLIIGLLIALLGPTDTLGMDCIRAELGKDTAWTGEPVALIITLYSPGPFSGTASFVFPELPATAFVQAGNPLVGSESIDGGTYLTQRHEFAIYTQRVGDVVIPAFAVRFAGKQTFTSVAEPVEGYTPELRFRSLRPPGTEHLGVVVAASNMDVSQTWQPGAIGSVKAGDVITRTIARRAVGTTAMMLPPIAIETPPGVRHYDAEPIVQDVTERGVSLAVRSETIKYQFERPGTFQLPDLAVTWWDTNTRALKRVTLPGKTVDVDATDMVEEPLAADSESGWRLAGLLLAFAVAAIMLRKPVERWLIARRTRYNDPATAAARRLLTACRNNAAAEAYAAGLQWQRAAGWEGKNLSDRLPPDMGAGFEHEWSLLSRYVFGGGDVNLPWKGKTLAVAFTELRRGQGPTTRERNSSDGLPALNPTHPARRDSD
jgi:hypothetical protein